MKKTVAALLALALLRAAGLLPHGREMESLQLITALAVLGALAILIALLVSIF